MDNHIMYFACDQGTIAIRRCHLCMNAKISEICVCKLNFDCRETVCDQYCRVSKEVSVRRINLLLALSRRAGMPNIKEKET